MRAALDERRRAYFPCSLEGAADKQRAWAEEVEEAPLPAGARLVAGADLSYHAASGRLCAALVLMRRGESEPLETVFHEDEVRIAYVPGFLSFREGGPILHALARLSRMPDLLICDGHGRAHPRRFGLACHVGVAAQIPTIGVGKSILVGEHREPSARRGSRTRLVHRGEVVGYALRTRRAVRPVLVSIGHRVDLYSAIREVLAWARPYRLPEPQRLADQAVSRWRRAQG